MNKNPRLVRFLWVLNIIVVVLQIWYRNVPHPMLAEVKGHQNWVRVTGEIITFPGGGTQFIHGALHYIDFIQQVSFPTGSEIQVCSLSLLALGRLG